MKKKYKISFSVTQRYEFVAETEMEMEALFEHYLDENRHTKAELALKIPKGTALKVGDPEVNEESLVVEDKEDSEAYLYF